MREIISIAATALGVLLELLALIGLARLIDAQIPKRTLMLCFGAGIGVSSLVVVSVVVGLAWGIEPILIGCLLFGLIPGTSLAAYGILMLIQWLNRRDERDRNFT